MGTGPVMIETMVRAVERSRHTQEAVAILEPVSSDRSGRLALPLARPEAHALAHELQGQPTLRAEAFALLPRLLGYFDGRVSGVELRPGRGGSPVARLRLDGLGGRRAVPVEIGQALSLAVALRLSVLVSEALLGPLAADRPVALPEPAVSGVAGPVEVPDVFRRAFDA
jgi:hypothetical protein